MPDDLSYSDTGQLTERSERGAARASKADQDRIGLEATHRASGWITSGQTVPARAIGDADDLADRRDAESVRLATIPVEDAVANLRIGIEQVERRLAEASRAHRETVDAWTLLTASLGLSITPEPADLLGLLAARDAVLDRHAARDAAQEP
jgi:hypothetical protein